jgi:peptide/nickel transport system substrate-binding protein
MIIPIVQTIMNVAIGKNEEASAVGIAGQTQRPVLGSAMARRGFLQAAAGAGAAGLLAACGGSGSSSGSSQPQAAATAKPKRGGNMTVGLTGGSSSDTIDPHLGFTYLDFSRFNALYDPLVLLNNNAAIEYRLAESITPNKTLDQWTIKLRPGITFHSGKPVTADDVIYTIRRILTGAGGAPYSGHLAFGPTDPKGLKAIDQHTVLVPMTQPFGSFIDQLAAFFVYLYVVPVGFDPKKPNGTGPFVYQSFTPGQRSVFTRNPHYWQNGLPYADTLTIIDFADTNTLANALTTGQVQAAGTLDGPQMAQLSNTSGVKAFPSKTGGIIPFTMRVDKPPFNDVKVRQAMRLLVNRPQLIDSALDGYGTSASDVFSLYDPDFDHSLVRQQDIPMAKSLLKQAGQEKLTVTLTTSTITTGTVAMATVLKEQAAAAGVTINLQNVPSGTFFGPNYLNWTFSQDYYPYSPYLAQVAYSMLPGSPFNETHTNNKQYISWYNQANATANASVRKEILHEMQNFDFTQGGYIIPAFVDSLDAYSDKIGGYGQARVDEPLSNFNYANFYFTE